MPQLPPDPYAVLGVRANANDAEIRAAYRRAVQRYHPDHNNGSPDSARKFEEVQEAYARIRRVREGGGSRAATGGAAGTTGAAGTGSAPRARGTASAGPTGAPRPTGAPPPNRRAPPERPRRRCPPRRARA